MITEITHANMATIIATTADVEIVNLNNVTIVIVILVVNVLIALTVSNGIVLVIIASCSL